MKKIKLFLTVVALLACSGAFAQSIRISGNVKESNGDPVSGAAVQLKGSTAVYTMTDVAGNYGITVPSDGVLVVSCLGYETAEIPVGGRKVVDIVLTPDSQLLDDVIVVAFGTTTKEAFTGSASVMKSEELEKHQVTNVANALVGAVPGLQMRGSSGQPGSDSGSMKIRGISSLYASSDPLIIVDGAPYPAALSNIPQSEIESVSVLKDAASAALYGARGAGGVIIITTKRGARKGATVNFEAKVGVNTRSVPEYDFITDPAEYYEAYYAQLYNYAFYGQGASAAVSNAYANTKMIADLGYQVYTVPATEQLIGLDGKLNPNATLGYTDGAGYYYQPDNWYDAAYKKAARKEYTVSVNGGNDRGSYFASVSYLDEDGVIEYSGFQRLNARLKADYQAKKWLKLSGNMGYVHTSQTSNPNLVYGTLGSTNLAYYVSHIAPIYPIYVRKVDANGDPYIITDANGNKAYDYGRPGVDYPASRAFLQTGNPLGSNHYNKSYNDGNQLNGNFAADIDILPFLRMSVTSTVIWGQSASTIYDNALYGPKVGVKGELSKGMSNNLRTNNVQTLTYFDSFGNHNVNVMLGHEYYKAVGESISAKAQGIFNPDILELSAAANKVTSASSSSLYNVEGYFASAQYNYSEKYYASASFRRDASSRFEKSHRWGSFWSFGGAWIISKESFMDGLGWLDFLKFKASIGQQGNDSIGSFAYVDLYTIASSGTYSMSPTFAQIGNPDITWETTTNTNIGAEFTALGGRISGSVDVYSKKTTDMLFWLSLPLSIGATGYYGNAGDVVNNGIEVALNADIIRAKDFVWNVNANFSHNKNKVISLPDSKKVEGTKGFIASTGVSGRWIEEGGSMYEGFYRKYAGVDEYGKALFWGDNNYKGDTSKPGENLDYKTDDPNKASYYKTGDKLPVLFGGFGTSISWKGFDASVTFDYQIGGKIYDYQYATYMSPCETNQDAGSTFHKDWIRSWSVNNTSSDLPRWQYGDKYSAAVSDRFLTSASYLNFQSFTVGYTLPKDLIKGISKIRVYAAGENLAFWSARQGLDPRYSFNRNEYVSTYNPVRTISGGVQVTF